MRPVTVGKGIAQALDPQRIGISAAEGPKTLADRAFVELREAILTARLDPGQRLRLDEVAQLLGMSVQPVREALRRLESASLVGFEPHRGATVAPLSVSELREIFELRTTIELPAIARAAEDFTDGEAAVAAAILAGYENALAADDFEEATRRHQRLHLALYRADSQPWLVRTLMPLWESSRRYWHWQKRTGWEPERRLGSHENLLRLCVAHDPAGAAVELERHLAASRDMLTKAIETAAAPPALAR